MAAFRLLLLAAAALAADEIFLDADNFDSVVTASGKPWVVEFYSEMCGSCKEFAPTWHAFADKIAGVEGLGTARVCVDKKPGSKLAGGLAGLFDKGIPQVTYFANDAAAPKAFSTLQGKSVPDLVASLGKVFALPDGEL